MMFEKLFLPSISCDHFLILGTFVVICFTYASVFIHP